MEQPRRIELLMSLRFYLKGTSLTAHYSYAGATGAPFGNVVDDPAVVVNSNAGVFGSSVISFIAASVTKGLLYPGGLNIGAISNTGAVSVRMRIVPSATAAPFTGIGMMVGNAFGQHGRGYRCGITSSGKPYFQWADLAGNISNNIGTYTINATLNVPFDFMATWDGTTTANAIKFSIDGVQVETLTATAAHTSRIVLACNSLVIGNATAGATSVKASLNDFAIWDTQENHVYTARTDFDSVPALDGTVSTDPGVGNVLLTTAYSINGSSLVGTRIAPTAAEIAAAVWDAALASFTISGSFGAFVQKLLSVSKFLGLK